MSTLEFNTVDQALRAAQAPVSAAEAHGCLCGAMCTVAPFPANVWITELLPEDIAETALQSEPVLQRLYNDTQRSLESEDLDFAPLLPDDEAAMSARIVALAQWAQGFLYGFGLGAPVTAQDQLPGDIPEVLKDIGEIARADDVPGEEEEALEQAYMELVEYLRAAVQLLYAELSAERTTQSNSAERRH
jgi:uncharacterized protein